MFKDLRDILKRIGGKFIIVEDGIPRYVILSFQEFKNLVGKFSQNSEEERELVNEKLSDLAQQSTEKMPKSTEVAEEEPTIEDIPL